jgi:hypothetical protein
MRDQDEINRLRDDVAMKEKECQENDHKMKGVDIELYNAQKDNNELDQISSAKDVEMKHYSDTFEMSQLHLIRCKDENSRLLTETDNVRKNLETQLTLKSELYNQSEKEIAKNNDLKGQLYDNENRHRNVDDNLIVARKEQSDLRYSCNDLMNTNNDIR